MGIVALYSDGMMTDWLVDFGPGPGSPGLPDVRSRQPSINLNSKSYCLITNKIGNISNPLWLIASLLHAPYSVYLQCSVKYHESKSNRNCKLTVFKDAYVLKIVPTLQSNRKSNKFRKVPKLIGKNSLKNEEPHKLFE